MSAGDETAARVVDLEEETLDAEIDAESSGGEHDEAGGGGNAGRVERVDKRWIIGGIAGTVGLIIVLGWAEGSGRSQGAAPPEPGSPAVERPEPAEPPYAALRPPFDSSAPGEAGDSLSGAPIPPPSSALVGPGDYQTIGSGAPVPAGSSVAPTGVGSPPDGASAETPVNPRRQAFEEALHASPVDGAESAVVGEQLEALTAGSSELPLERVDPAVSVLDGDSLGASAGGEPAPRAGTSVVRRLPPGGIPALTVISAALITSVNTEEPGDVIAQVSRDVVDATGRTVIPRGSLLFGRQSDQVTVGEQRVAVAWSRLQLPDYTIIELPGLPTLDGTGAGGVQGNASRQSARTFGNALMVSLLTAGVGATQRAPRAGEYPSLAQAGAAAVSQELAQLGAELLRRDVNARPTVRLSRGQQVRVILRDHLVIPRPGQR